ncbi:hypothetical protein DMA15_21315 [Streptomyces sp. WAC 01529]|uniref:hypothetical protein n=1 Tax=Streptomyces sp. WAC 01529 TaxID=2203205 RepID=UPI000F6B9567|nr:hypothetical protein [Streptomyces sp. WAC 01529]AZM54785.1 hypothetical protein DMA15_21315 [Streptomyces sp. WAC 01529]
MALRTEWDTPPSDYTIFVPAGWFQLHLDPDERDRGIAALADRQFAGIDHAPVLKENLMRDLQKQAKAAYRSGGLELYISLLTVRGLPLASSLLVSLLPEGWPGCRTPYDLARRLAETGRRAEVRKLEVAGDAVREQRTEGPDPERQMGNTLDTTTVIYHVPVPASEQWLTLTFSTPMEGLAPAMVELFDTVAGTLHWE